MCHRGLPEAPAVCPKLTTWQDGASSCELTTSKRSRETSQRLRGSLCRQERRGIWVEPIEITLTGWRLMSTLEAHWFWRLISLFHSLVVICYSSSRDKHGKPPSTGAQRGVGRGCPYPLPFTASVFVQLLEILAVVTTERFCIFLTTYGTFLLLRSLRKMGRN